MAGKTRLQLAELSFVEQRWDSGTACRRSIVAFL